MGCMFRSERLVRANTLPMDRASTSSEPPRCPGMRAIPSNPRLFDANAVRPGHALPACLALPPSRARPRFCYGLPPRARISPPATGTDGLPPQGAGRHWNRGGSLSAPGAHGIRACAPEMPARGARERVPERSGPFRDGGPARGTSRRFLYGPRPLPLRLRRRALRDHRDFRLALLEVVRLLE